MADGTDGTIIILDWCDAHNSEKETRMHTRAGEKKNFPRLANRPYRRTNYHPESQQSVPFSFARILAFSSTHHENFHLAPLIYRNLNLSLSLSACKCLHGTPTWTRTFVLLVSRTLSFLSPNRPPPIPESEVPRWSCVYKDRLFRVFSRRRFDLALPLDRLTRMRENDVDTAISGTALLRAFQRESLWIVLFNSDRN